MSNNVMSCHTIHNITWYVISRYIPLYPVISRYIISHHIISYQVISYLITSHHSLPYNIISFVSRHALSCLFFITSCNVTSHQITSHHITSYTRVPIHAAAVWPSSLPGAACLKTTSWSIVQEEQGVPFASIRCYPKPTTFFILKCQV